MNRKKAQVKTFIMFERESMRATGPLTPNLPSVFTTVSNTKVNSNYPEPQHSIFDRRAGVFSLLFIIITIVNNTYYNYNLNRKAE